MLDKTELLQLIEAPIGQKCLITDPFPTSKTKQFQVVMKPGIASDGLSAIGYGFEGAANCKKRFNRAENSTRYYLRNKYCS